VVLGRYKGQGPSAVTLTGAVGKETRDFVYELSFPNKTAEDRGFIEHLWGRRKVGYLLDQIRANGEKKELVDEVVVLAKKYGIATPYTSYLIMPDRPVPVAAGRRFGAAPTGEPSLYLLSPARLGGEGGRGAGSAPAPRLVDVVRSAQSE